MTKAEEVTAIARMIGVSDPGIHTGSSVPDFVFRSALVQLGLPEAPTMPDRARTIVEAAGLVWDDSCDSRNSPSGGGSTVTLIGLRRTRLAVSKLLAR